MVRRNRASRGLVVGLGLCALLPLGCQSAVEPRSEITAAPTLDELPNLKDPYERKIAAKIDFEGSRETTRIKIVPDFKPVEPTPEEKAILGEPRKSVSDELLAFYRPPRGPEHGVSPREGGAQYASFRAYAVGIDVDPSRGGANYYVFGEAGRHALPHSISREGAAVYGSQGLIIGYGLDYAVRIGYNPPRSKAERAPRLDY